MFNSDKHQNSIFGYFGTAVENGDLLLQSEKGVEQLSCQEVLNLWKKRKSSQSHLLIVLDCNYSGQWVEYLQQNPDSSVSIQSSCKKDQKSYEGSLGGIFTHNCMKVFFKKSKENLIKVPEQEPDFIGSILQIKKNTNLLIYFKGWPSLETYVRYNF